MPMEKNGRVFGRLARPLEIRSLSETGQVAGYGSVFGVEDWYQDIVMPGAFERTLKERGLPKMLWQHDTWSPVGVWQKASEDKKGLYLEGQIIINTTMGKDVHQLLKAKAIDGMSIGYSTVKAEYDDKRGIRKLLDVDLYEVSFATFPANEEARVDDVKAMTHSDVAALAAGMGKLYGVCKTCVGSINQGEMMAGMDGLIAAMAGAADDGGSAAMADSRDVRTLERALRDVGLTQKEAKAVLADGFKALRDVSPTQRDAGLEAEIKKGLLATCAGLAARMKG